MVIVWCLGLIPKTARFPTGSSKWNQILGRVPIQIGSSMQAWKAYDKWRKMKAILGGGNRLDPIPVNEFERRVVRTISRNTMVLRMLISGKTSFVPGYRV